MSLPTWCSNCGSALLQPLRARTDPETGWLILLRCAECFCCQEAAPEHNELAELDSRQAAHRQELVAAYESSVSENMRSLSACFERALALDLVSADDFAPRRRRRRD